MLAALDIVQILDWQHDEWPSGVDDLEGFASSLSFQNVSFCADRLINSGEYMSIDLAHPLLDNIHAVCSPVSL